MIKRILPVVVIALVMSWVAGAIAEVPDDATKIQPLGVGEMAPVFDAHLVDGDLYRVDPGQRSHPSVLIFYRGGWCPYCNNHLKELQDAEPVLLDLGFEVLFLSADRPEILYSSLREEQPSYTLLSDANMEISRAFGIAFVVDDAILARYKKVGLDLEEVSGYSHHQRPVPAVFIIDAAGVIQFVYADPDYRVRLDAAPLVEVARDVVAPATSE
jgi:peroxiredoxin